MSNRTSGNRPPATLKDFLQRAARPLGFLLLFVMICAFLAQYLTGSETLEEYAHNNPELAYGSSSQNTAPLDDVSPSESIPAKETSDESAAYHNPEEPAIETGKTPEAQAEPEPETVTNPEPVTEPETGAEEEAGEVNDTMTINPERTVYQDGFYYEPLSEDLKQRITGISYPETGCSIPYEDLNYVRLLYVDFNGEVQEGELICNKAIAKDMTEIFYELYQNDYRIERIRLIDEYNGDDTLSMMDNNTSCFNYRVVDGTTSLSKHALGCAIDINPFYNPYVVYNKNGTCETYISPKGSEVYADRSLDFPYKIDENDLCYKLFTEHGFSWGGNWNSSKDYQHFQIIPGT